MASSPQNKYPAAPSGAKDPTTDIDAPAHGAVADTADPASGATAPSARTTTPAVRAATWAVRIAYLVVFAVNVQCALGFIAMPDAYAPAYELTGVAGDVAVAGLGVAFLMWNVTYPAVIVSPRRFHALGVVVLIQQVVGLVGESIIYTGLPSGHELLADSIARFITFDAFGLCIMAATFIWLIVAERRAARHGMEAPSATNRTQ
jgi:hypothetical protein